MSQTLLKEFHYKEKVIPYTLRKSSRARRMRLTVHYDGRVVVTIPERATERGALRFLKEKRDWLLKNVREHTVMAPSQSEIKREFALHKRAALELVVRKLAHFNSVYKLSYNRVSVKNHRSQWGSCSTKGNLNFNYRILFLPDHIADYIVVHELCHLREPNHSTHFWALVEKTIPQYETRRNELRKGYFI